MKSGTRIRITPMLGMALYLLVGLAWVLLGDELIEIFVDDPHLLTRYQTWKGWVYVIVTAVLAWWLLRLRSADAAAAHQAQQRLNLAAAVLDNTIEGVVVTDAQSRILSINPAGTRLLGYTEEELLGRNPRAFKSGRHDKAFYDAMWDTVRRTGHWRGEIWNQRKNGEVFPERMSMSALRGTDGVVTHYVCMFTDISQEKSQHQRLEFLAHFDPLTGLNNRAWFGEQLEEAVQQARATGEQMALLLLNLDRFKDVNDSYGHAVGDDVLKHITRQVLQRLQALGVRIAVDDFGTGYSSLAHLKRFPIDVLKIDQGFTRDIPRSADDMAISAAIIAMGHSLGLTVLAEGVETPEQLAFLRERGCDDYQGYLCSRPVPPDEFARLLLAQAAA